jgi:hypothetical protein
MANNEILKKMIWIKHAFSLSFNTVKTKIGWKLMNKERKISTKTDKEFQNFEGLIRNSNIFRS